MKKLENRVALITGAGRGIGRATALKLAGDGAKIVVNDLDAEPAENVVAEIVAAGGEAVACPGSITDPDYAKKFVGMALDTFGGIHIIVNNAGYTWDNVIQKMTDEQFDAIIDVHLKAPFRILREAGAYFRSASKAEAAAGTIIHRKVVNVSSLAGTRGNPGQVNYGSAKAGIIGMTKVLCSEWGRYRINVNAVAFGFVETRLTEVTSEEKTIDIEGRKIKVGITASSAAGLASVVPLGRGATVDEAAGSIYLLCIPESDYISGQVLEVAGGF